MSLQQKLIDDLKEAVRQKDENRRSVIRMARAAIIDVEIAEGHSLDDDGVLRVIAKEIKQRRESIAEFSKGGRQDLAGKEQAELEILQSYLPRQMSRDEIVEAARRVIEQVGDRGPTDMGKVMPRLLSEVHGMADGREVNQVVRELLSRK